jgi:predicted nuclease with TOPRIM domain
LESREELKLTQSENTLLKEELQKSQEQVASLEAQLITLLEKAEFFDTHIVFVQEDGTNSFHRYDCDKFARNGYRAYNKEQALSLGYIPCEDCN